MPSRAPAAGLPAAALLAAALLAAGSATAQQPPAGQPPAAQQPPAGQPPAAPDAAAQAEQLFLAGREAVKKGDLPLAAEKFQKSEELYSTPGTLLNLASVEEQLGKLVKALEHFEGALKGLPEGDERRAVAAEGASRIRARIPSLRIDRAAGAPADMTIRLGGNPVAASSIGAYQLLDPGTYTVTTGAPGHDDRRYEVKLAESARNTLAVEPGPATSGQAPAPVPQAPSSRPSVMQAVGFALGGFGIAGLGIGAVTGGLAIAKKGDAASACPDPSRCNGPGLTSAGTAQTLAAVSTASFVLGLAGAAVGVTLVVVGRDKPAAPSASVGSWMMPGGMGVGATGRF